MKNLKSMTELFESLPAFMTIKYELFNFLEFNRKVCNAHVKTIEASLKKWGFESVCSVIKTNVIDGVTKFYVLDGQHRITAAMRLGIPFKFVVKELNTKRELMEYIADLNTTSKGWGTNQFLKVWGGLGIPEYLKLKKVMDDTGFQITVLLRAYTFSNENKTFKTGDLTFPDERHSDRLIKQLVELNQYLPTKAFVRRTILRLMEQEKYNHKKMVKALKFYTENIGDFPENELEAGRIFQNLINNNQ